MIGGAQWLAELHGLLGVRRSRLCELCLSVLLAGRRCSLDHFLGISRLGFPRLLREYELNSRSVNLEELGLILKSRITSVTSQSTNCDLALCGGDDE